MFLCIPPHYTESLTMDSQRLPALAWWARIEGDLVSNKHAELEDLPLIFDVFASELPKNWTSRTALSTYSGDCGFGVMRIYCLGLLKQEPTAIPRQNPDVKNG